MQFTFAASLLAVTLLAAADRIVVSQPAPGRFEPGDWDDAQRVAVSGKLNALLPYAGGDPKAANYLRIMPGWTYVVRLYRPRVHVLTGSWTLLEPTPAT